MTVLAAALVLALLVVVPVAAPLHPAAPPRTWVFLLGAALPATAALLLDQGSVAVALVVPWVAACVAGALLAARLWLSQRGGLQESVWVAAAAYLVVGAAWLAADRAGIEPLGYRAPFVQLTAIHFHYAGFTATVIASCAWRRLPDNGLAATAAVGTVLATPVVALGFVFVPVLQVVGAVLFTVALWLLAWVTVKDIAPATTGAVRTLLTVSSLSVLVPMLLAIQWTAGSAFGTPALSIPVMARTHGAANALLFALPAVVAWRLTNPAGNQD